EQVVIEPQQQDTTPEYTSRYAPNPAAPTVTISTYAEVTTYADVVADDDDYQEPSEPGSSEPGPSGPEPSEPGSNEPEPSEPEPSEPRPNEPELQVTVSRVVLEEAEQQDTTSEDTSRNVPSPVVPTTSAEVSDYANVAADGDNLYHNLEPTGPE